MPTILLTGATGYRVRRLEKVLREREDITLRLLFRNAKKFTAKTSQRSEIVEGDSFPGRFIAARAYRYPPAEQFFTSVTRLGGENG